MLSDSQSIAESGVSATMALPEKHIAKAREAIRAGSTAIQIHRNGFVPGFGTEIAQIGVTDQAKTAQHNKKY
jgi:hypothetical protein